jgi:hypothetical protein
MVRSAATPRVSNHEAALYRGGRNGISIGTRRQ